MISNSPKILKQMMEDQWRNGRTCVNPLAPCRWRISPTGLRPDNEPFTFDRDDRSPVDSE